MNRKADYANDSTILLKKSVYQYNTSNKIQILKYTTEIIKKFIKEVPKIKTNWKSLYTYLS